MRTCDGRRIARFETRRNFAQNSGLAEPPSRLCYVITIIFTQTFTIYRVTLINRARNVFQSALARATYINIYIYICRSIRARSILKFGRGQKSGERGVKGRGGGGKGRVWGGERGVELIAKREHIRNRRRRRARLRTLPERR